MTPTTKRQLLVHVECPNFASRTANLPPYFEGYLAIFAVFNNAVFSFIYLTIPHGIPKEVLLNPRWATLFRINVLACGMLPKLTFFKPCCHSSTNII